MEPFCSKCCSLFLALENFVLIGYWVCNSFIRTLFWTTLCKCGLHFRDMNQIMSAHKYWYDYVCPGMHDVFLWDISLYYSWPANKLHLWRWRYPSAHRDMLPSPKAYYHKSQALPKWLWSLQWLLTSYKAGSVLFYKLRWMVNWAIGDPIKSDVGFVESTQVERDWYHTLLTKLHTSFLGQ